MEILEMRLKLGDTQSAFAARYGIPFRTVQNWESGVRRPAAYLARLLEERVARDLVNRRTAVLPRYDPHKRDLPKRSDFVGSLSWLRAVRESIGEDIVFALDEALMCGGLFGGRNDESVVWIYGRDTASSFNGVAVLGNKISSYCVQEKDGLRFTDFDRTLSDALANEAILDMQGITEALSRYYFTHGESFRGLSVAPEYQERFERLAVEARDYYGTEEDV